MRRDFLKVALQNFLIYFVFYLLISTIAPYSAEVLGASPGLSGLASGIFVIGILFGRLYAGYFGQRVSARRILILGNCLFLAFSFLYLWAKEPLSLVVLRFLHGLSFGIAHNACGTIAAGILPPERRGEGIAYYTFGQIISAALGPFVGIKLAAEGGFSLIFILGAAVASSSLLLSFLVPDPQGARSEREGPFGLSRFIEVGAISVSAVIMLTGLAFSGVLTFLSMYGSTLGLTEAAGYFFVVYGASVLATRPLSGRLLDRWGAMRLILPCLVFTALGLFLLGTASSAAAVLASGLLIGLGYGNILSLGQAEAVRFVPHGRIAVATATYFIFLDIGAGFGPYLCGLLIPSLGYRGLYLLLGLLSLMVAPLYWVLTRGWRRSKGVVTPPRP